MGLSRGERKDRLSFGDSAEIARRKGKARSYVSEVLNGKRRDREIEVAIARKCRVKVADAFPEFYQQKTA